MTWFRLDDRFHAHPKVRRAGNAAVGLWVRACTYSSAYGTDGRIDLDAFGLGTPDEISALVDVGLWVPNGTGFVVPDFLDFNPSAEQVAHHQRQLSDARRVGGLARANGARRDDAGHFAPNQ